MARSSVFMLRSENLVGFSCHPCPKSSARCQPAKSTFTSWANLLAPQSHIYRVLCLLLLRPPLLPPSLLPSCFLFVLLLVPGQSELHRDPVLSWIKIKGKKKKTRMIGGSACWPWVLVTHLKRGRVLLSKFYTYCLTCIFFFFSFEICLPLLPPSALRD